MTTKKKLPAVQTVSIFGMPWTIEIKPCAEGVDGICDKTIRTIFIDPIDEEHDDYVTDLERYKRKVLRHEMIHAALFESGREGRHHMSEQDVDWIAVTFPKLIKAFEEAGCMD